MIWANINNKEDYNISHTHPYSHYSGVYYVKVPKNSGNLYFGESTANLEPINSAISSIKEDLPTIEPDL